AGADALRAVADAYRAYAEAHPGSYAALQRPASGSGAYEAAATMAVDTMLAVVAGYGLEGDEAIHAVRGVRAALHGFVTLEREAGFAISLPTRTSYDRLVAMLDRALASTP
ncbi:MAG: TetR-like C-terminal domain-containing protein, partial [Solirubrobacteraceae bacterium]